jgi:hypothetical protein
VHAQWHAPTRLPPPAPAPAPGPAHLLHWRHCSVSRRDPPHSRAWILEMLRPAAECTRPPPRKLPCPLGRPPHCPGPTTLALRPRPPTAQTGCGRGLGPLGRTGRVGGGRCFRPAPHASSPCDPLVRSPGTFPAPSVSLVSPHPPLPLCHPDPLGPPASSSGSAERSAREQACGHPESLPQESGGDYPPPGPERPLGGSLRFTAALGCRRLVAPDEWSGAPPGSFRGLDRLPILGHRMFPREQSQPLEKEGGRSHF